MKDNKKLYGYICTYCKSNAEICPNLTPGLMCAFDKEEINGLPNGSMFFKCKDGSGCGIDYVNEYIIKVYKTNERDNSGLHDTM